MYSTISNHDKSSVELYEDYISQGWTEPLPLPRGEKGTPPKGTTGKGAAETPEEQIRKLWESAGDDSNLGLRLPAGVIAIDVDHAETFSEFVKAEGLPELPETFYNTRHGAGSDRRHRYFRVPVGIKWRGKFPGGDVLQMTHRYSVVWPSVVDGQQYRWYDAAGNETGIPSVDDVPALPEQWREALQASGSVSAPGKSSVKPVNIDQATEWLQANVSEFGEEMGAYFTQALEQLDFTDGAYPVMQSTQWRFLKQAITGGTSGLAAALERLGELYEQEVTSRSGVGRLSAGEAEFKFSAALTEAVAKIKDQVERGEIRPLSSVLSGIDWDKFARSLESGEWLTKADSPEGKPKKRGKGLVMKTMEEVEEEETEWLWEHEGQGAIPMQAVTIVTGKGELGKSTMCRWLGSEVTHGTLPGFFEGQPRNVLYLAAEESNGSMVKPSFRAHNADMSRINIIETDGEENVLDPGDMNQLVEMCVANDVALVIVDPMPNYMNGANLDKSIEVREQLKPWTRLAEKANCAVLAIFHQNKSGSGDVVHGISGNAAVGQVARSVLGFARDEETGEHVMSQEKSNLGERMKPLAYRIESVRLDGRKKSTGRFALIGPSEFSAGEVQLRNKKVSTGEKETAQSWLKTYLRDNGPTLKSLILQAAKYSESSIEKAASRLEAKRETKGGAAVWSLP